MPAKRGDRVAPPPRPGGWEARFATSEAAKGWEELCRVARANAWEAWVVLTERPTRPENPARQHRLRGQLAERLIHGRSLEQWQYEVTAAGRIWYCPDHERGVVWVVHAGPAHPRQPSSERTPSTESARRVELVRSGPMSVYQELAFEDAIERAMLDTGWRTGQGVTYRRKLGLDTAVLFEFLGATQIEQWNQLVEFEGGDRCGCRHCCCRSGSTTVATCSATAQSRPPSARRVSAHKGRQKITLARRDMPGLRAVLDWFAAADTQPVEFLSLFGKQGERAHLRARPRTRPPGRPDEEGRKHSLAGCRAFAPVRSTTQWVLGAPRQRAMLQRQRRYGQRSIA